MWLLCCAGLAAGQPASGSLDLGEVVVTGSGRGLPQPTRRMSVITREDIESLPASSVQELLEYAAGVDVKQRGPVVQADYHLRGGSFEQTAVLVDGVRVNDPQTGHHNSDIPVTLEDIERIEILHGLGGAADGADAIGGAINIVTRPPGAAIGSWFRAGAGSGSMRSVLAGAAGPSWRMSAERAESAGFREGTDYGVSVLRFDKTWSAKSSRTRVAAGWTDKLFGAHSFYVPGWASRERTDTRTFDVKRIMTVNRGEVSVSAYARAHSDRFECSSANPSLCLNGHRTRRTGVEIAMGREAAGGSSRLAFGLAIEQDRLSSSNMGSQARNRMAAFAQANGRLSRRLTMDAGLRAENVQGYGALWAHSVSAAWAAAPDTVLHAAQGRTARIPTYTELFYRDPAHLSSGSLGPEIATAQEAGARVRMRNASFDVTLFSRRTYHFIDWHRADAAAPWLIGNNSLGRCRGASMEFRRAARGAAGYSLSHDAVSCEFARDGEFKYADARPRHIARAGYRRPAWRGTLDARVRYEKPRRGEHVTLTDLAWKRGNERRLLTLQVSNLFDRDYEDVPGAPMPGRAGAVYIQWNR